MKPLTKDKQNPGEPMSRHRTQLPDKSTTNGPGQELVAWLPFENRHADVGSVLGVYVCAPVSLESYPPPCLHICIWSPFTAEEYLLFCTITAADGLIYHGKVV